MAKKKNGQINPAARGLILLIILGIPLVFVLASVGTKFLADSAPYLILVVMAIVMAVYGGTTASLLYDYYEVQSPWYRFVPCYGELVLMDSKFLKIGSVFYVFALIFFGISRLPYTVLKIFGTAVATSAPFYFTLLAFIALLGVQIVKGIGLVSCMKNISGEWEEKMHTSLGFIKSFSWLGFIPFVRVIAVYALNKPLSTLVTFNDVTASDSSDVVLDEE